MVAGPLVRSSKQATQAECLKPESPTWPARGRKGSTTDPAGDGVFVTSDRS